MRSSTIIIQLLGNFNEMDKDTDVLIREILSWASIVDLHKILLLNSYFSKQAKQCEQWEKLLAIVPIPSNYQKEWSDQNSLFECDPFDLRFRFNSRALSPYKKITKLMPNAQYSVRKLLSVYDLALQPRGFRYPWHDRDVIPHHAKRIECVIRTRTQYPKRWILLHNIISLTMAAEERVEPNYFLGQFGGYKENPNTGSAFRVWYKDYMGFGLCPCESVGSDEHLRLILGDTQKEWVKMVTILGSKALAKTFDVLNIVRENLEELILTHPGPSEIQLHDAGGVG